MTAIPEHQQIGPAGHHHAIAYRPGCQQLLSQLNPQGLTDWFVTMPDGSQYILATIPPTTPNPLIWLDSSGICKTGGEIVPILSPEAAASVQSGRLTLTPQYVQSQSFPVAWVLVAAVVALGMGAIALRNQVPTIKLLGGGNED